MTVPKDSSRSDETVHAVILAGGSGTRLWPLSRTRLPKQFLRLGGERNLLEETVDRLRPLIDTDRVLVVTGADHASGEGFRALRPYATLLEPVGRNTAPAIALAAAWLRRGGGDPVMVVLPADHVIRDAAAFRAALTTAIDAAKDGALVTFGIRPARPDTGFGYVKTKGPSGEADLSPQSPVLSPLPVERFVEKPDLDTARRFLAEGGYWWNSGMFVWRASAILRAIERHLPEVAEVIARIESEWNDGPAQAAIDRHFTQMPSISIDHGILEKAEGVLLVPCDIGWSDVGSWDAVHEIAERDDSGNALHGRALAIDCRDNLIHAETRLVAAVGVEGLCVVETADAVLITRRGQSQRVREVVGALEASDSPERIEHLTVQRPWGSYTVLETGTGFKMKRITVEPGARLSLQSHRHRSEHWVVVSGTATVTRDSEVITVEKNESTFIPIGMRHRLENRGTIPLEIIEVQVGDYVGEDDVERFDDQYGRR